MYKQNILSEKTKQRPSNTVV